MGKDINKFRNIKYLINKQEYVDGYCLYFTVYFLQLLYIDSKDYLMYIKIKKKNTEIETKEEWSCNDGVEEKQRSDVNKYHNLRKFMELSYFIMKCWLEPLFISISGITVISGENRINRPGSNSDCGCCV